MCIAATQKELPHNVAMCQAPDGMLGCNTVVQQARRTFEQILPGHDMFAAGVAAGDDSDEEAIEALDSALSQLE